MSTLPDPLPEGLRAIGEVPAGRRWLATLPQVLVEIAELWQLEIGAPLPGASASLTTSAVRAGGEPVVLKLQFPHREAQHEAAALARWDGNGAVRLLGP